MSAKSKGTSSPIEGTASKAKVVEQIDTLTSDLQLEDEMTDSSKTDTLNSSSSSTTASSLDKVKVRANAPLISPPAHPAAVLTVLRKPNPPPPPPRLTPVKFEETHRLNSSTNNGKHHAMLLRNGLPGGPVNVPNGDRCSIHNIKVDKVLGQSMTHRTEKERCPQATTRERVRFSENVLYHGYCPDCDVRSEIKNKEVHLHGESVHLTGIIPHHCPPLPPPPLSPFSIENGGLEMSSTSSHPSQKPGTLPPPTAPKPQKTILRKSTTTTV
ncbi:protein Largen isoform 2-T2 [Rhinophrynus dorsalis]